MGRILSPVYDAVAWVLKHIYGLLSPVFGASSGWTWALSIVFLVVLMRLIMVPLFVKQMHTTRAMSTLAPQISALRKKYKNDKQTLNQETMKLYQEAGVNPLMGCIPVVAQLPLFFALFNVLRSVTGSSGTPQYGLTSQMVHSAKSAKILGATVADKFLHATTPLEAKAVILVAVLVSMATTFLTVRQSMKRGMMPAAGPDNPMGQSQKYMAYIMPLFALSGLYWPFGLVLYWVTTNVWTLGQQWVLFRRYPKTDAAGGAAASAAAGTSGSSGPGAGGPRSGGPRSGGPEGGGAGGSGNGGSGAGGPRRPLRPAGILRAASAGGAKEPRSAAGLITKNGSPAAGAGSNGAGSNGARSNGSRVGGSGVNGKAGGETAGSGGLRRRLSRRGPEPAPAPPPAEPEVKLLRQQPQRQSRSKRSGKR